MLSHRKLQTLQRLIFVASAMIFINLMMDVQSASAQGIPEEPSVCPSPNWTGFIYNSPDLSGNPAWAGCRRLVNFDWGTGSPFQNIRSDEFSTRWATTHTFPTAGTYEFTLYVAGGARLTADGVAIIDSVVQDEGTRVLKGTLNITCAGQPVNLVLETFHYSGTASVNLVRTITSGGNASALNQQSGILSDGTNFGGGNVWSIQHWLNPNFEGSWAASSTHNADGIAYDYNLDPPAAGFIGSDWSSRWTRSVDFPANNYTFYLRSEDRARLLVDGIVVVNYGSTTGSINLSAGIHTLVVEHIDDLAQGPEASIFLTWDPPVDTMLATNGCNSYYMAGVAGNSNLCNMQTPPTFGSCPVTYQATDYSGLYSQYANNPDTTLDSTQTNANEQITICHIPPGNPDNPQTLQISQDALQAHLDHGDSIGACSTDTVVIQSQAAALPLDSYVAQTGDVVEVQPDGSWRVTSANGTVTIYAQTTSSINVVPEVVVPTAQIRTRAEVNFRTGPGLSFPDTAKIPYQTTLTADGISPDGAWLRVTYNGQIGWVSAQWVEFISGSAQDLQVSGIG